MDHQSTASVVVCAGEVPELPRDSAAAMKVLLGNMDTKNNMSKPRLFDRPECKNCVFKGAEKKHR
jgi:hypothetical protein